MGGIFTNGLFWALLGVALAVLVPGLGSSKGVGMVGEAASAVISDEPEKFGQLLLLQALPATNGIYGFLTAFVILTQIGFLGGDVVYVPLLSGMLMFLATLPIIIVGYFSAIKQARIAVAAVGIVVKRPEEVAKGMIVVAMCETYAVLALLTTVLLVFNIAI